MAVAPVGKETLWLRMRAMSAAENLRHSTLSQLKHRQTEQVGLPSPPAVFGETICRRIELADELLAHLAADLECRLRYGRTQPREYLFRRHGKT